VVAIGPDKFGYALCRKDDAHLFSKKLAIKIAIGRAEEYNLIELVERLPYSLVNTYFSVYDRAQKYFKQ